jgi:hypothetical protein
VVQAGDMGTGSHSQAWAAGASETGAAWEGRPLGAKDTVSTPGPM